MKAARVRGHMRVAMQGALADAAGRVAAAAGHHAYAELLDRHVTLERLYAFSQAIGQAAERDVVIRHVLDAARELLTSDQVRLVLGSAGGHLRVTMCGDGEPRWESAVPKPLDQEEEQVLASRDLRNAVAVPLEAAGEVIGMLLVGGRQGEVRGYGPDDRRLLENVARQASVALERCGLIEQLQHEALHDALTGLPNRKHFQLRLTEALAEAPDPTGSLAVVILDLDGFKDVNDTLGHHQGDLVLAQVADRLARSLGSDGFVSRLGGDEFAILLPRTSRTEAQATCERVVAGLRGPIRAGTMQFEVGASVGIAFCPERGFDGSALMKRADIAMYEAKSSRRRIVEYTPSETTGVRRLAGAAELRSALTAGDVDVHVQPQQDVLSGEVRGVEALARWFHDELGPMAPAEFIPVAERSGLIGPLTEVVLDASLRAAAVWVDHSMSVSVNVSPRNLLDPSLVTFVGEALQRWDVPPHRLVLEVTEGAVMTDPVRSIALLHELRQLGVRLSIDDFGTGHSSLSYLRRLPVHEVKIDRSFVTGLVSSAEDHAIVRSIVALGRDLGLDVVAEGVEDQATYDALAALGCTRVQGWHVARPMPIDAATEWLARRSAPASVGA